MREEENKNRKKEKEVESCIFSSNAKKMPFCFVRKKLRKNLQKKRIEVERARESESERMRDKQMMEVVEG